SVRERPTFRKTDSARSARVTVFPAIATSPFPTVESTKSRGRLLPLPRTVKRLFEIRYFGKCSPAQKHRAPGKTTTHGLKQYQIAPLDPAIAGRHREGERDRGGGGVSMQVDGDDNLFRR